MAVEVTNKIFQSDIHNRQISNPTDYALFLGGLNVIRSLGGLNVTRDPLLQYDPLKSSLDRIFMFRQPSFANIRDFLS